jgi:hypothetical protein
MSKAFAKESDGDDEDDLPEDVGGLPVSAKNYMTPEGFARLREELNALLRKERRIDNPNPQMTYRMWAELMDGPEPNANAFSRAKAACPKMVGEWTLTQESQALEHQLQEHLSW